MPNLLQFPLAKSWLWKSSRIHSVQLSSRHHSLLIMQWATVLLSWGAEHTLLRAEPSRPSISFDHPHDYFNVHLCEGLDSRKKHWYMLCAHQLHPKCSPSPDIPGLTRRLAELGLWQIACLSKSDSFSEWIGWNVPCLDAFRICIWDWISGEKQGK